MRTLTVTILTLALAACSAPSSRDASTADVTPTTTTVSPEQAMKSPAPAKAPKVKVQVAWLGIDAKVVTDGIRIDEVRKESPATQAGLAPKDVIVAVNGTTVTKAEQLREAIRKAGPGNSIVLRVRRAAGMTDVKAVLGSRLQDPDDDDDDDEGEFDDEDDDDEEDDDDDEGDDDEDDD